MIFFFLLSLLSVKPQEKGRELQAGITLRRMVQIDLVVSNGEGGTVSYIRC